MNRIRLLIVTGAVLAALAVWAVAELVTGTDLRAPAFGGATTMDIAAGQVLGFAALASLAGWGTLALVEKVTARARPLWTGLALVAFLVSLGGPLSGTGVSTANRWWLAAMHVAVAAVLIPGLRGSAALRQRPAADARESAASA